MRFFGPSVGALPIQYRNAISVFVAGVEVSMIPAGDQSVVSYTVPADRLAIVTASGNARFLQIIPEGITARLQVSLIIPPAAEVFYPWFRLGEQEGPGSFGPFLSGEILLQAASIIQVVGSDDTALLNWTANALISGIEFDA